MGTVEGWYLVVYQGPPTYPASTQFRILVKHLEWFLVKFPSRFQAKYRVRFQVKSQVKFQARSQDNIQDNIQGGIRDNYLYSLLRQVCSCFLLVFSSHSHSLTK